jgi:hypothetical protein
MHLLTACGSMPVACKQQVTTYSKQHSNECNQPLLGMAKQINIAAAAASL